MSNKGLPLNGQRRLLRPSQKAATVVGTPDASVHTFTIAGDFAALGQVLTWNGYNYVPTDPAAVGGSVKSVSLSGPKEVIVSGSPVTGSGTLSFAWGIEAANTIFSGPTSGAAATPGFRAMSYNDLPVPIVIGGTSGTFYLWNTSTMTYWTVALNALGVFVTTDTTSATPP